MQQGYAIKASESITAAPEKAGSRSWRALDRAGKVLIYPQSGQTQFILPL